jgi:hypothetical protein
LKYPRPSARANVGKEEVTNGNLPVDSCLGVAVEGGCDVEVAEVEGGKEELGE